MCKILKSDGVDYRITWIGSHAYSVSVFVDRKLVAVHTHSFH